jgi:hypothetical protein
MRSGRVTPVEFLVIIAVFGVLGGLLLPAGGSRPPLADKELKLENWQPGPEHAMVPPDSIRVQDAELDGLWTDRIGWLHLDIEKMADGRYSVSFLSRARCGHSGSVQLERYAEYQDGVVHLDRPVRELNGTTYAHLYSVRANGEVYLLPAPRVNEFDVELESLYGVLARAWKE